MKNLTFKQTAKENRENIAFLDKLIKEEVESTDLTAIIDRWVQYVENIKELEASHAQFHASLLELIDPIKGIKTMIRALIKEAVTNTSYVDRNVVAYRIGKKLLPKGKVSSQYNKASTALSLGLNIINIGATCHLLKYKMRKGAENHTISSLEINSALLDEAIINRAKQTRAGSFMHCQPIDHTDKKPGGYLKTQETMLNGDGFGTIKTQSNLANQASNKLQAVRYSIRSNYSNKLINEYKALDKWFNDKGQYMNSEWAKFGADLKEAVESEGIYFPVAYDKRGRIYDRSAYIKYQGDKYQKSMLEFSNKEVCTEEGFAYLVIALANEVYSDKCSFEEAIEWYENIEDNDLAKLVEDTGNPIAITLYQDVLDAEAGKEVGTVTHWDATNSALQFYSILGADAKGASLCNVLDTGVIADAYGELAKALNNACEFDVFNRKTVKHAFMIYFYGGMERQLLDNKETIKDDDRFKGQTLRSVFPEELQETAWEIFEDAMNTIAPSAYQIMSLIYSYNREDKTKYCWTMPDGFKVETTETKTESVKGWFIDHNGKTHEGSIDTVLEAGNKYSRALAPNVIHSIDAYFLREVVRRCDFELQTIHDSFGCHPNNAAKLHQVAREVAADMLEMDILEKILMDISPEQTMFNIRKGRFPKGELTREDILNSSYILR